MNAQTPLAAARATGPLPPGHPVVKTKKVGVLIVNLGTPDGTTYRPMRRYLKEFLSDKRVIETSRWVWYPILYGIVLTTRPTRSGKAYASIWNDELDESPLRTFTRAQGEKLAVRMAGDAEVVVDWAMRYGRPSIAERADALLEAGCDRILVYPLYPQYSSSTTATVNDKFFAHMMTKRWMPAVRTVPAYHDEPVY
ncbi:MAG: ferrochelatase, partial [Sphingomonadales bacterium]